MHPLFHKADDLPETIIAAASEVHRARYGESAQSALAFVEEHAGALGDDPFALEDVFARLPQTRVRGACRARRGVP